MKVTKTKIDNIVKLLCTLSTSEVRNFTKCLSADVVNEIANRFGVNHNAEEVALAITRFGKSTKNVPTDEEDENNEIVGMREVA